MCRCCLWLLLWLVCCGGCATHADRIREVRWAFHEGDVERAAGQLDKELARRGRDQDVLKLEKAVVELSAGRPREAERLLREVRDQFDHLEQASLAEPALALALDDQQLAYAGEDYEKVLIRAMLALANLMSDGGDAGAYALQVEAKQRQVIEQGADRTGENPKLRYKQVAVGAYLHGVLREQTHTHYDDAARCYERVVSWAPGFRSGRQDLERVQHGRHSTPGHGVVYVFALVGRGPYKEQTAEMPTSAALLVADRILSATGRHSLPPTISPVKVPRVVRAANEVNGVLVAVDGRTVGSTETVTDVGQLAVEQYEAVYHRVLARAVVRRVFKKGVVYGVKEAIKPERGSLLNLALDATGVAWEATEAADTRCWGLLPDKIQVLRLELPAGQHRISLQPARGTLPRGTPQHLTVSVADGRNTYLLANFPGSQLAGQVLVSGQ